MEKLLLHICCGPDLTYSFEYFSQYYDVIGYFYNPNIDTLEEYEKRYKNAIIVSKHYSFDIIKGDYESELFYEKIKGFENLPERSDRCLLCHTLNLEKTFIKAKEKGIGNVSTTLTISPHKMAHKINQIGKKLSEKYKINFIEEVLRKNNGFKKSIDISNKLNLYRQNYCACKFSRRHFE